MARKPAAMLNEPPAKLFNPPGTAANAPPTVFTAPPPMAALGFTAQAMTNRFRLLLVQHFGVSDGQSQFRPEAVAASAATLEPHKVITYLNEVAENYHRFYHNNRVIDAEAKELSYARLKLCEAARIVLKNGFDIIGISAPKKM